MPHLVWDWNGTLLDDLTLVVAATNASLAELGGPAVTAEEHRRDFRRPIAQYYGDVLGRVIDEEEFVRLDKTFHVAYAEGLLGCALSVGAMEALSSWAGTQSLLSMWFHHELVPTVSRYGLDRYFARIDGLRDAVGGGPKAPHLVAHLRAQGLVGDDCVLIGDSEDDAIAAQSVGARCVLYTGGFTDPARLRAVGVPVADTLAEAARLAALS
ncbi:HAD family hydrolase [Rugosimonospora africana]|uniref:Phosphatase n=1 Tax=Rugosimonospora africana TaxID=556532 RepID=A0A8J3QLY5_9ACTN|nr:HAD hydrolase-like protein [Rugosimonospora africana]GIH12304.1 phosphatase [Rugosimonospora africana]